DEALAGGGLGGGVAGEAVGVIVAGQAAPGAADLFQRGAGFQAKAGVLGGERVARRGRRRGGVEAVRVAEVVFQLAGRVGAATAASGPWIRGVAWWIAFRYSISARFCSSAFSKSWRAIASLVPSTCERRRATSRSSSAGRVSERKLSRRRRFSTRWTQCAIR